MEYLEVRCCFVWLLFTITVYPVMVRAGETRVTPNSTDDAIMKFESRAPGEVACSRCLEFPGSRGYDPVCGPDGFTYYNDCYYKCIHGDIPDRDCCETQTCQEYRGSLSRTRSGKLCSYWVDHIGVYVVPNELTGDQDPITDANFPDRSVGAARNYCRNPDGGRSGLWCYVGNREPYNFDLCDVPRCRSPRPRPVLLQSEQRQIPVPPPLPPPTPGECTGRPGRPIRSDITYKPYRYSDPDSHDGFRDPYRNSGDSYRNNRNTYKDNRDTYKYKDSRDPYNKQYGSSIKYGESNRIRNPFLRKPERFRDQLDKLYSVSQLPLIDELIEEEIHPLQRPPLERPLWE